MTNPIVHWWRSRQFRAALAQGKTRQAKQLLQEIQKSGAKLSLLEKQFRDKLKAEEFAQKSKQEVAALRKKLSLLEFPDFEVELLKQQLESYQAENLVQPNEEFIQSVLQSFKILEIDEHLLQCTGIYREVFDEFEASLGAYLKEELYKINRDSLEKAHQDINRLKSGQDPQYSLALTPHVYLMRYFLENVYCAYLAWFLIYKSGLLPAKLNILDIAAGPGTIAYGLSLFLKSASRFLDLPNTHISYYSLEQLDLFQYRGLQFWRRYIEPQQNATNAYFRFDTTDIFDYQDSDRKIPENFFDFAVVCHCFFSDPSKRRRSYQIYKEMFASSLKEGGCVLLIVQDKKLFMQYNERQTEDLAQEQRLVQKLVGEMGLKLVWYKYLNSTGKRAFMGAEFGKFASKNLPAQTFMNPLLRQHLGLNYDSKYTLDDYVILAQRG